MKKKLADLTLKPNAVAPEENVFHSTISAHELVFVGHDHESEEVNN